jgi:hypothetical protein
MDKYTSGVLRGMDRELKKRFGLSLTAMLEDPASFTGEKAERALANMREYVNKRLDEMISSARENDARMHDHALRAGELTARLSSYIAAHARQSRVPVFRPASFELAKRGRDLFYIGEMNTETTRFIDRLVESSSFIVDMTAAYPDYSIGSWLFAGERGYVVGVRPPMTSSSLLTASKVELNRMIGEAQDSIRGL